MKKGNARDPDEKTLPLTSTEMVVASRRRFLNVIFGLVSSYSPCRFWSPDVHTNGGRVKTSYYERHFWSGLCPIATWCPIRSHQLTSPSLSRHPSSQDVARFINNNILFLKGCEGPPSRQGAVTRPVVGGFVLFALSCRVLAMRMTRCYQQHHMAMR